MLNVGEVSRTRYSRPNSIEYIYCHKQYRLYTDSKYGLVHVKCKKYTNVPLYGWAFWIARTVKEKDVDIHVLKYSRHCVIHKLILSYLCACSDL